MRSTSVGDGLRGDEEDREEPRVELPGLPEGPAQLMVGLDLLRQLADVAELDPVLLLARSQSGVSRTHLLVARLLQLRERRFQLHGEEDAASVAR
jgi:hypothetical protein